MKDELGLKNAGQAHTEQNKNENQIITRKTI